MELPNKLPNIIKLTDYDISNIITVASDLGRLETSILSYIASNGKSDDLEGLMIEANVGAMNVKRLYETKLLSEISYKEFTDLFIIATQHLEDPGNYSKIILENLHNAPERLTNAILNSGKLTKDDNLTNSI